ncbi:MAG: trypsin-like peptidase domain-containing protein [Chloroflexi bacterium]|nr:trypsin-like peptidase domain-containing protein [Chloroflexota bacterium]
MTGSSQVTAVDPIFAKTTLVEPFLRSEGQSDKNLGSATGFFFEYNQQLYLITNRHVLVDESKAHYPDHVRLRLHGRNNLTEVVQVEIPLVTNGSRRWIEHQQPGVDVAAVPLPTTRLKEAGTILSFGAADLVPGDVVLGWAQDVVVVGYPLGFYDDVFNLPIMRRATVASAYGVPFRGEPRFLIDAQLHEGTSESPVVSAPQTMIQRGSNMTLSTRPTSFLLGVHSASLSLVMQSREGDGAGDPQEQLEPLGLSVVWYARLIEEMLAHGTR